ncbi:predicted protein [Naegleria gruberi]|uniref:Predicted protein n=1 Tax=Naegleria gruberi TaxID=5762 RepID=D2VYC5_NAEGR|nr:uncharacterized protein NAEGRDRAFT_74071 [Naegleria gruberi]EFC38182.1 predicted protein [Naegleria gruberi]|eukprot:XP_002670926.1 predicted protein [Naegleria gruberi strain NEG-M]
MDMAAEYGYGIGETICKDMKVNLKKYDLDMLIYLDIDRVFIGMLLSPPLHALEELKISSACSGHGGCISPNNCSCVSGYYGSDCSQFDCYGTASTNTSTCTNHGSCISPNNCSCLSDYYGKECTQYDCFGTISTNGSVCSGHGTCLSPNNCSCLAGYYGNDCSEFDCYETASTNASACSGHGGCISPNNCSCLDGYYGNVCSQFDCYGTASTRHFSLNNQVIDRNLSEDELNELNSCDLIYSYTKQDIRLTFGKSILKPQTSYMLWKTLLMENSILRDKLFQQSQLVTFVDPFAGSGTLSLSLNYLFTDNDPKVQLYNIDFNLDEVSVMKDNCSKNRNNHILNCDSRFLPFRNESIDVVISDMPFGVLCENHSRNSKVYPKIVKQLERIVKPDGIVMLLTIELTLLESQLNARNRWTFTTQKVTLGDLGKESKQPFTLARRNLHKINL